MKYWFLLHLTLLGYFRCCEYSPVNKSCTSATPQSSLSLTSFTMSNFHPNYESLIIDSLTADGAEIYPDLDMAAAFRSFAQAWDVVTPYILIFPVQRLFRRCSANRDRFKTSDIANSERLQLTIWRLRQICLQMRQWRVRRRLYSGI